MLQSKSADPLYWMRVSNSLSLCILWIPSPPSGELATKRSLGRLHAPGPLWGARELKFRGRRELSAVRQHSIASRRPHTLFSPFYPSLLSPLSAAATHVS